MGGRETGIVETTTTTTTYSVWDRAIGSRSILTNALVSVAVTKEDERSESIKLEFGRACSPNGSRGIHNTR